MFWCSLCDKPIDPMVDRDVIFVCRGFSTEPVPDGHERLKAMHVDCAGKIGLTHKYRIYDWEDPVRFQEFIRGMKETDHTGSNPDSKVPPHPLDPEENFEE